MKAHVRNIFPGGNTPEGFYSYYSDILPQRKAKKIFCIKGGPGVGKSTLMKGIGTWAVQNGEAVDLLWCSSDPDSLDGVLLKDRNVAVIDGTAPHMVDPKNPAAVDQIVDLGSCWNEAEITRNKEQIIELNEDIGAGFELAYGYLRCAGEQYKAMERILMSSIEPQFMVQCRKRLYGAIASEQRNDGAVKKAFAGAITHRGIMDHTPSLIEDMGKLFILHAPVGFPVRLLLEPMLERLIHGGFDAEGFYCPMNPAVGLEHMTCHEAELAVITANEYHGKDISEGIDKTDIHICVDGVEGCRWDQYQRLLKDSKDNLKTAVDHLKEAKSLHDALEAFYVSAMDFDKVEVIKKELMGKIQAQV